jgi:hypothetical protein
VERHFVTDEPSQLWISHITCVWTAHRFEYTAFVIDMFSRRIVGWRTTDHLRTDLVRDALDQAIYDRLDGLTIVADLAGLQSAQAAAVPARGPTGNRACSVVSSPGLSQSPNNTSALPDRTHASSNRPARSRDESGSASPVV